MGGGPRGPFKLEEITSPINSITYPTLWNHDHSKETKLVVAPNKQGIVRGGCEERAQNLWEKYAGKLCFNQDYRLNSQPLTACLTTVKALGGQSWPRFVPDDDSHEVPIMLFANTTLGLIAHWWIGSRQQLGRSRLSITKIPDMITIDPREFTKDQFETANIIFELFKEKEFRPANEAYRDNSRKDLDYAVLVDLLGLPESVMESLNILRYKWCCEPSVHGGKLTRPEV